MEDIILQDTSESNLTPKTTYIYVLIDPETNEVRYVGKANNPQERLYRHVYDATSKTTDTYKDRWICNLYSKGLRPILQIVEEVLYDQWELRECFWIDHYRSQGCLLTNTAVGGRGGQGATPEEVRARISAAKKGTKYKPTSEDGRRNMSIAHKGLKMPRDGVERAAAKRRGTKASPETRAKLSASHKGIPAAMKGRKQTPEARAKMSLAKTGKKLGPMPEETKRKISEAQIGKKISDETRARLSASHKGQISGMKGRKQSLEARAKMSLTKRRARVMKENSPDIPTLWD